MVSAWYLKILETKSLLCFSLKALMVIAICKTKEEDTDTQVLFWQNLNRVMQMEGFPDADFAGFMGDEAGANWLAIKTVYNGGPQKYWKGENDRVFFIGSKVFKNTLRNLCSPNIELHTLNYVKYGDFPNLAKQLQYKRRSLKNGGKMDMF